MKNRFLIAAILLGLSGLADGQFFAQTPIKKTLRAERNFTLRPGGSLLLENPVGNIDVVGGDSPNIDATLVTTITGANEAALEDAQKRLGVFVGGDAGTRVLRMNVPPAAQRQWSAVVNWTLKVPRKTHLRVVSQASGRIRIADIAGNLYVKSTNGMISVVNATAGTVVESVNGSISYTAAEPLRSNVILSTVNGSVTANVPGTADLRWVAETISGDIRTNLPARGAFFGNVYRGTINAPGGPTLTTATLMGNVHLLGNTAGMTATKSLRQTKPIATIPVKGPAQGQSIRESFTYQTDLGDVQVTQIKGDANIYTGAGQVQLGAVAGSLTVVSNGGPFQFGEVGGIIKARTRAGDILVDTARRGGSLETQGGTITVLYTAGPTELRSGGGDVVVRQAAAPVKAETSSGDVSIAVDRNSGTERVEAKTAKGNIVLYVPKSFAADVEATIVTSNPEADTIASDIPGLSISRSQVGSKTRIHATGKLNGGGQRVVLDAVDGDIRITTASSGPTVVRPQ